MWRYPPRICQAVSSLYGRVYRNYLLSSLFNAGFLPVREGVSSIPDDFPEVRKFPPCTGGHHVFESVRTFPPCMGGCIGSSVV